VFAGTPARVCHRYRTSPSIAKDVLGITIAAMLGRPEFNLLLARAAREKTFSIRVFVNWLYGRLGELYRMVMEKQG
jgi:hypothetical protein